ncbi:MAG: RNA polymerase sigma factor [Bacteroidota bacterium]
MNKPAATSLSAEIGTVCQEATFSVVFSQQVETLRNFCLYRCQDSAEAEDYVQEAFLRLWKNCAKVPPTKAKSFLFKVAQNLFYHRVEHEKVVKKYLCRRPALVQHKTPEREVEEKEMMTRFEQAIQALSEKQRVVFLLHRIDGKTYKEIAEVLSISVKSVEKRMHRALLALSTCIPSS